MKDSETKENNPLKAVWDAVSVIGGVLSLFSFFDDLVAWKSLLPQIIEVYQTIVRFPFTNFNFEISQWVIDYLFFGTLSGSSFIKAIGYGERKKYVNNHGNPKSVRVMYFFLHFFFWPLAVLNGAKQVLFGFEDEGERKMKRIYFQWVFAILLIFLIILIGNTVI